MNKRISVIPKIMSMIGAVSILSVLNGCILTGPYYGQKLKNKTTEVPLQAWTTIKSASVTFQCAKASPHSGLYPYNPSNANWIDIVTKTAQGQSLRDALGGKIYGASSKKVIPEECWKRYSSDNQWYTAVRAKQGNNPFQFNFDKVGLECLGREIGKGANWFSWLGKGCEKKYFSSTSVIPYSIVSAPY